MPDELEPNPRARERLIEILRNDVQGVLSDRERLTSLLAGWGGYEGENTLLIAAFEQRVPQDLLGAPPGPVDRLVDFLASRLSTVAKMPYSNAKWAVESWALALGKELEQPAAPPANTTPNPGPTPAEQAGNAPSSQTATSPQLPPIGGPPPAPTLAGPKAPTGSATPGPPTWPNSAPQHPPPAWQGQPPGQQWNPQQFPGGPPPQNQGVWPPPAYGASYDYNTSGTMGPVPPAVEQAKWSWGAFQLSWIWLMAHNMVGWGVIALVANWLCSPVYLAPMIYLGISGNRLAWQNRRYESVEHFLAVEKIWSNWGIALFCLSIALGIGYVVFALLASPSILHGK